MANTHPRAQPSLASSEVVRHDCGGWISGPSLGTADAAKLAGEHAALTRLAGDHPAWRIWRRDDGRWVGECKLTPTRSVYLTAPTAAELAVRIDAEDAQ